MSESMKMANRIREKRIELGLTMEELGAKVGVQKSAVNKWEHGAVENIKRSVIQKLSEIFNVSPAWLMGMDDENGYYLNEETAQAAQEIFENKEMRMLFDAARDASPEDLKTVHTMLLALKRKENNND